MTEFWLRGPLEGIDPYLMPAAHALRQAREELEGVVRELSVEEIWRRPGQVAAIGFHLRHIAGAEELLEIAREGIDAALECIRVTPRESLLEPREVGRKRLPSTVLGLLSHIGEHTARHTGQVVTTAKLIRAETARAR